MAKQTYLFVAWLFALIMAGPAAAQQAETAAVINRQAVDLYQHGKVREAARLLRAASARSANAADKILMLANMADMCSIAADWSCVEEGLAAAVQLIGPGRQFDLARPRLMPAWMRLQVAHRNDAAIDSYLRDARAAVVIDPVRDPADLAMTQLALHDWYALKNDLVAAERSLAIARTALLRMDARFSDYGRARVLVFLLQSLRFDHDIAGATALALRIESFISKSISRDSAEYALYVFETAQLSSYSYAYDKTAAAFGEAIGLIEQLDISAEEKAYRLAIANGMASAALVLAGKPHDARAMHARHPLQAQKQAILARGSFASMAEFYFAVSDVFVGLDARLTPDRRWKPLFDKDVDWKMDAVGRREFEAFRNLARGKLAVWGGQAADGARFLKLAARQRIDNHDAALRAGFEGFPLPSLLDGIVVGLGAEAATRSTDRDAHELMLAASELQWRTLHDTLVEAAVLLNSQDDDATRRDAKAYLELLRRKRTWEVDRITDLPENTTAAYRTELVRQYTEMATELAALKARLQRNPKLRPAKGLPSLEDLQRALAPGDAYVAYFQTISGLGKLCVTPNRVFHAVAPMPPSVVSDMKLVGFATTASYPPDPALDAQFPVASALRLHDLLFAGLGSCLRPGTHVIVALPEALSAMPLGALLDAAPPRVGEGYDLAKAHWLIHAVSFSRVLAARQYLATTRYLRRAPAPRPYLGVGDPKLNATHVARLASTTAVHGAPVVQGATHLAELPETAEELAAVAALLHAPAADVLLHEAATERAFRQKPLGEYQRPARRQPRPARGGSPRPHRAGPGVDAGECRRPRRRRPVDRVGDRASDAQRAPRRALGLQHREIRYRHRDLGSAGPADGVHGRRCADPARVAVAAQLRDGARHRGALLRGVALAAGRRRRRSARPCDACLSGGS